MVFWFLVHSASYPDVTLCEFRVVIKVIKKTEALCHPPPEWSLLYLLPLLGVFTLPSPSLTSHPPSASSCWRPVHLMPLFGPLPDSHPSPFLPPHGTLRFFHEAFHLHGTLKSGGTLNPMVTRLWSFFHLPQLLTEPLFWCPGQWFGNWSMVEPCASPEMPSWTTLSKDAPISALPSLCTQPCFLSSKL